MGHATLSSWDDPNSFLCPESFPALQSPPRSPLLQAVLLASHNICMHAGLVAFLNTAQSDCRLCGFVFVFSIQL